MKDEDYNQKWCDVDILKRSLNGQKAKQICDELGYKYHTIQKVIVRKNWSHVEI